MLPKPQAICSGCPLNDPPNGSTMGFSRPDGDGTSGVLMVAEALGASEVEEGIPLVGKAGHYWFNGLNRVGITRDHFTLFNVVACRPPDNKLVGMPWEKDAIEHCRPNLDAVIEHARRIALENNRTFTILTLGKTAFLRVMGLDAKKDAALLKLDYIGYPLWNETYKAFVVAADHPSFLMRGNHHLAPISHYATQRAVEIARDGLTLATPDYLLDPEPMQFKQWVDDYLKVAGGSYLSYDIETPMKQGKDEEAVSKEEDDDYRILRCSFSYRPNEAVSVPWAAQYLAGLERLFGSNGKKVGWNNCPTPDQRVLTSDLLWKAAGDLDVGDRLVGIDNEVSDDRRLRRFKTATVTHASPGRSQITEVVFADGSRVKVTNNHPWLLTQRHRKEGRELGSRWVPTNELQVGQKVNRLFEVWNTDHSREGGYLAGFFDGEGYVTVHNEVMKVGASQNMGPTLDRVLVLLRDRGYLCKGYTPRRVKDHKICNFTIVNGRENIVRFLGSIRPNRLVDKFKPEMIGSLRATNCGVESIAALNDLGEQDIIRLSTDSHTYILEGFAAHNSRYDDPRIRAQMPINGDLIDSMLAWHVLNSSLPKGLGFVAPFYVKNTSMWKHLSEGEPAFYNAKDADMALQCWLGIHRDLQKGDLGKVFDRHVIEVDRVFHYMSEKGVKLDLEMRKDAEERLQTTLNGIEEGIAGVIPPEVLKLQVYKNDRTDTEGLVRTTGKVSIRACPRCGIKVKVDHYKSIGVKRLKKGEVENPCVGLKSIVKEIETELWARPIEFKLSNQSLQRYGKSQKHITILDPKRKVVTYDEKAISRLVKKYPKDPLYPRVVTFRKVQKLLSTYVGVTQPDGSIRGGMPTGPDGRVHTSFGHNPSTLRSASQNPNLQNLPRPAGPDDPASIIRNLIVAGEGMTFLARDFSGIEAVLVGYFAADPGYVRLSRRDVHSFYTAYALHELDGRVSANDLPLLSWDDDKLFTRLGEIKKEFKEDRNNLYKHLVHGANFFQGPKGAAEKILSETGIEYPVTLVKKVMDIYFELFPSIRKWHSQVMYQADKDGYLRNPFGYVHRFSKVFDWEKVGGKWQKSPGPQANEVVAFGPQSTAAAIIKEAMLRLHQNRWEEAGQFLRLLIHDELMFEVPEDRERTIDQIVKEEMERPIPELRMPASWGMGDCLSILTEEKVGKRWGQLK